MPTNIGSSSSSVCLDQLGVSVNKADPVRTVFSHSLTPGSTSLEVGPGMLLICSICFFWGGVGYTCF